MDRAEHSHSVNHCQLTPLFPQYSRKSQYKGRLWRHFVTIQSACHGLELFCQPHLFRIGIFSDSLQAFSLSWWRCIFFFKYSSRSVSWEDWPRLVEVALTLPLLIVALELPLVVVALELDNLKISTTNLHRGHGWNNPTSFTKRFTNSSSFSWLCFEYKTTTILATLGLFTGIPSAVLMPNLTARRVVRTFQGEHLIGTVPTPSRPIGRRGQGVCSLRYRRFFRNRRRREKNWRVRHLSMVRYFPSFHHSSRMHLLRE